MKRTDRPAMQQAESVGSLLKQVLGSQGLAERLSRYQAWLIWDKLVGEQIARRARPLRIRQGVLEVQVDHPVWMQQLQMLKPKILEKLHQQIPNVGISDIYLRKSNAPLPLPPTTPEPASAPKWQDLELSPAEQQQIAEQLTSIKDQDLREELRKLLTRQKQLDNSRNA